jgi:ribonuclease BN (tRNA processing enzyme)
MRVRLLPCAPGAPDERQDLVGFLVDARLAVDAGPLGLQTWGPAAPPPADVLLTHAHLDHVATLPMFLEDLHDRGLPAPRLHGPPEALAALRAHLFHRDVGVPDEIVTGGARPWATLHALAPGDAVEVAGFRVTPVPVRHPVTTFGYVVDDGRDAVVFGADSGPTERLWQVAPATGRLRAAFLECSFPDTLEADALRFGHLTPRLWRGELALLPESTRVVAVHVKHRFRAAVLAGLAALGDRRVSVGAIGAEVAV